MNQQWQLPIERLWPSRSDPRISQALRMVLLQAVIALAIALAAGPEVFAAMEMTTLLEMLGASLFLTAYAAGVKLKAIQAYHVLHSIVLPGAQVAVIRSNAPASWKALAFISVLTHAAWCLSAIMVAGAYGHHLLELAI